MQFWNGRFSRSRNTERSSNSRTKYTNDGIEAFTVSKRVSTVEGSRLAVNQLIQPPNLNCTAGAYVYPSITGCVCVCNCARQEIIGFLPICSAYTSGTGHYRKCAFPGSTSPASISHLLYESWPTKGTNEGEKSGVNALVRHARLGYRCSIKGNLHDYGITRVKEDKKESDPFDSTDENSKV